MVAPSDVLRATTMRFLPALVATTVGGVVVTALTSGDGLRTLRQASWPMMPVRFLVIGTGFSGALLLLRRQLAPAALQSGRRVAIAVACTAGVLLAASVLVPRAVMQRGGLASGIALDLTAGATAALVAFVASRRGGHRVSAPAR
jgi:hypothetical protein